MSSKETEEPLIQKEKTIQANIVDVMQTAYIDYSMSVIISRALPDVRDGLKPVHRRILYAMLREGLVHNRPFDKCAGVVGEVLKNYHPHGDTSVYDSLVRMAQNWVMRYPLIDPQGNFGSIDGDSPAAYRYTECRLKAIAEELLQNIDEDTIDFVPNYKENTVEPVVLPSTIPNLLMNGSTGIAVGMTTNIPPHNLTELIDATCLLLDNPNISLDELVTLIKGPDFPTGGVILGRDSVVKYLKTGRGIVRVRGIAEFETHPTTGRESIIIKEIPYNVNRADLVIKIAGLVSEKVLTEISDIRDESDEQTRIVIELKRGEMGRIVVNKLFQLTQLENSFGVILLALHKQRPKQMNIKEMLECFIEHRRDVIYRRTLFRKRKTEARLHILEGYKIALDNLDDFVKIIRASKNKEEAKEALKSKYVLSDIQANAILELRLYQLTNLERGKVEDEYAELLQLLNYLNGILESETQLLSVIKEELLRVKTEYATPRKTTILDQCDGFQAEDVIPNVGCMITVSHKGFIKRTEIDSYRPQKRGGKGVIGTGQYEEDFVEHLFTASTHDYILFVMNNGRVYVEKVYEIPEGSRISKGRSIANVLMLQPNEKVAAMLCFPAFDEKQSLVIGTKNGVTKKTCMKEYSNIRKGGCFGIVLDDEDEIIGATLTSGENELMLVSYKGMSIRFHETDLRNQGRVTRGVRGMKLKKNDFVNSLIVVDPTQNLLISGENGQGKRTDFDEFKTQKRGGSGVISIKTKGVASAITVQDSDDIMLLTQSGQSIRIPVSQIRSIGRTTMGVRLINLNKDDKLIGVCKVIETDEV